MLIEATGRLARRMAARPIDGGGRDLRGRVPPAHWYRTRGWL